MIIKGTFNTRDGRKQVELMVGRLETLDKVLRLFGKYLRQKAAGKFKSEGPGWDELAASTKKRLEATGTGRLTDRGKVRQTARVKAIVATLSKDSRNAAALDAIRKVSRSGGGGNLGQLIRASSAKARQKKELLNLAVEVFKEQQKTAAGKAKRSKRAITKHKILGRLASTIRARTKKNQLIVFSVVPWSGVHNEGGSAGRGSRIPARTFLELDDEDLKVLERMIAEYVDAGN